MCSEYCAVVEVISTQLNMLNQGQSHATAADQLPVVFKRVDSDKSATTFGGKATVSPQQSPLYRTALLATEVNDPSRGISDNDNSGNASGQNTSSPPHRRGHINRYNVADTPLNNSTAAVVDHRGTTAKNSQFASANSPNLALQHTTSNMSLRLQNQANGYSSVDGGGGGGGANESGSAYRTLSPRGGRGGLPAFSHYQPHQQHSTASHHSSSHSPAALSIRKDTHHNLRQIDAAFVPENALQNAEKRYGVGVGCAFGNDDEEMKIRGEDGHSEIGSRYSRQRERTLHGANHKRGSHRNVNGELRNFGGGGVGGSGSPPHAASSFGSFHCSPCLRLSVFSLWRPLLRWL